VSGTGWADYQHAFFGHLILIPLRACEYENVFVALMFVYRNVPSFAKSKQCCRWARYPVSIEAMDINSVSKWIPFDGVLVAFDREQITKDNTIVGRADSTGFAAGGFKMVSSPWF